MLDLLRAESTKRFLIISTALAAIVLLGMHFFFNVLAFGEDERWQFATYQTLLQITGGLVAGVATTAYLLFISRWLLRSEKPHESLRLLTASESNKEHLSQLANTKTWMHNGHIGRWVRTEVIPAFKSAAKSEMALRRVELVILDPQNTDLLEAFAEHRILMDSDGDEQTIADMVDDTRREIVATILCAAIAQQHDSGLEVGLYLRKNLDFVRVDITEHCVFNTVARPYRDAVAHYKVDGHADMYNVSLASFREAMRESRELDLRLAPVNREPTADQVVRLMDVFQIGTADESFAMAAIAAAKSNKNAYSRSR